jgi:hypothetical protein
MSLGSNIRLRKPRSKALRVGDYISRQLIVDTSRVKISLFLTIEMLLYPSTAIFRAMLNVDSSTIR